MSKLHLKKVGVIDFGVGNLKSVANALLHVGARPIVSNSVAELSACGSLILPGVGAFQHGINALKEEGLFSFLQDISNSDRNLLGICLGMQMLTEASSEFGEAAGLGILSGRVDVLGSGQPLENLRLPNVGWLGVERTGAKVSPLCEVLLEEMDQPAQFYFIHSYAVGVNSPATSAISRYEDQDFSSVISENNVVGVQFHPEKSGEAGLRMLRKFVNGSN